MSTSHPCERARGFAAAWRLSVVRSRLLGPLALAAVAIPTLTLAYFLRLGIKPGVSLDQLGILLASGSVPAALVSFLLFGVVGIEVAWLSRTQGLRDVAASRKYGWAPFVMGPYMIAMAVLTLSAVAVWALSLWIGTTTELGAPKLANLNGALYLDLWVPGLLGALLGLAAANFRRKSTAYSVILAAIVVVGPAADYAFEPLANAALSGASESAIAWLVAAVRMLGILAPDSSWAVDTWYGLPAEPLRWILAGYWAVALMGFGLAALPRARSRRFGYLMAGAVAAAAVISWAGFATYASIPRQGRLPGSAATGFTFVAMGSHPGPESSDSWATASVQSYDIDIEISSRLSASVTVTCNPRWPTAERAQFTLFRGYRVSEVLDGEGGPLEFSQSGDVVTCDRSGSGVYLFRYQGSGWRYYSNEQAVFLPPTFPWYPWPGVQRWWIAEANVDQQVPNRMGAVVPVHLKVDAPYDMWSNVSPEGLPERGGTEASGEVAGVCIAGSALHVRENWSVFVDLSMAENAVFLNRVTAELVAVDSLLGAHSERSPGAALVVRVPQIANSDSSFVLPSVVGDTVLIGGSVPAESMPRAVAAALALADTPSYSDPGRASLYWNLYWYLVDGEVFLDSYQDEPRPMVIDGVSYPPTEKETDAYRFARAVRELGASKVLPIVHAYLTGTLGNDMSVHELLASFEGGQDD